MMGGSIGGFMITISLMGGIIALINGGTTAINSTGFIGSYGSTGSTGTTATTATTAATGGASVLAFGSAFDGALDDLVSHY